MRARLGPASRAAMQFGATLTSRDIGTLPLTAPTSAVGRLFGLIGLTSPAAGPANASTDTTPSDSAAERRIRVCTARIQAGLHQPVTDRREPFESVRTASRSRTCASAPAEVVRS